MPRQQNGCLPLILPTPHPPTATRWVPNDADDTFVNDSCIRVYIHTRTPHTCMHIYNITVTHTYRHTNEYSYKHTYLNKPISLELVMVCWLNEDCWQRLPFAHHAYILLAYVDQQLGAIVVCLWPVCDVCVCVVCVVRAVATYIHILRYIDTNLHTYIHTPEHLR